MNFEDYGSLYKTIENALEGSFEIDHFNAMLRNYKSVLTDPREEQPTEASRERMKNKIRGKSAEETYKLATKLLNKFCLNEDVAIGLLLSFDRKTESLGAKQYEKEMLKHAEKIYTRRRNNIMLSLVDLASLCHASSVIARHVDSFMEQLLNGGLVENTVKLIKQLHERKFDDRKHVDVEIWRACMLLLLIFRTPMHSQIYMNTKQAVEIVKLLRDLKGQGDIRKTRLMLLLTLINGLFRKIMRLRSMPRRREDMKISEGGSIQELKNDVLKLNQLTKGWPQNDRDPYKYLFMLIFSIYEHNISTDKNHVRKLAEEAMREEHKIFSVLRRDLLEADWFKRLRSNATLPLSEAACDLLGGTIKNHFEVLDRCARDRTAKSNNFTAFLEALASLCRNSPICATTLCNPVEENNFKYFIKNIRKRKDFQTELQVPYLNLLASLCGGSYQFVWQQLQEDRGPLNTVLNSRVWNDSRMWNDKFQAAIKLLQGVLQKTDYRKQMIDKGLLGCMFRLLAAGKISIVQKGHVWDTIRAIGKHYPAGMKKVWHHVEGSKIITRIAGEHPSDFRMILKQNGIVRDLEAVETEQKVFNNTIAFIKLICEVVESWPPVIYAIPMWKFGGMGPYCTFMIENVLLKLDKRYFKYESQKWEMALATMKVFCKILEDFDPSQPRTKSRVPAAHHAGMALMHRLSKGDEFFDMIVKLVYDAKTHVYNALKEDDDATLSAFAPANVLYVEKVLLYSLKFLAIALEREMGFPKSNFQISNLMLQASNVVLSIIECLSFVHTYLTEELEPLCFYAAKVLNFLTTRGEHLISNILHEKRTSTLYEKKTNEYEQSRIENARLALLYQFTTAQVVALNPNDMEEEKDATSLELQSWSARCKVQLIQILLNSLTKKNDKAELTCMILDMGFNSQGEHSVLDEILNMMVKPRFAQNWRALAEGCFELFYRLYSHPRTSQIFSAFLQRKMTADGKAYPKSSPNPILFRLLDSFKELEAGHDACTLLQYAWLLKCIALDVFSTSKRGEWSDSVRDTLCRLGFWRSNEDQKVVGYTVSTTRYALERGKIRILRLLDSLSVRVNPPNPLPSSIANIPIQRFRMQISPQLYQYDLRQVKFIAEGNLKPEESHHIMSLARDWNSAVQLIRAAEQAIDGWRQLCEVCLHEGEEAPHGQVDGPGYDSTLRTLLSGVLKKLCSKDFMWQWLGRSLSTVALTVMAKIRLRANMRTNRGNMSSLATKHQILEEILEAILGSGYNTARANLYAVFINYMQYVKESPLKAQDVDTDMDHDSSMVFPETYAAENQMLQGKNLMLLRKFGTKLLSKCCKDAMSGQLRVRAMAMVFLSNLLTYDSRTPPEETTSLSLSASSSSILDQLLKYRQVDQFVKELLDPERSKRLKAAIQSIHMEYYEQIISYEILASLLVKIALRKNGAQRMLEAKLVSQLADAKFLSRSLYQDLSRQAGFDSAHTVSKSSRYYQLLIPSLHLIDCMLTTLPKNLDLKQQSLNFLRQHEEVVHSVLEESIQALRPGDGQGYARNTSNPAVLASLEAANLLTGIIASLSLGKSLSDSTFIGEQILKKLKMLLNKLPEALKFDYSDKMTSSKAGDFKSVNGTESYNMSLDEPDNALSVYEILRNITLLFSYKCLNSEAKGGFSNITNIYNSPRRTLKTREKHLDLDIILLLLDRMLNSIRNPEVMKYDIDTKSRTQNAKTNHHRMHLSYQIIENILQILYYHLKHFGKESKHDQKVKARKYLQSLYGACRRNESLSDDTQTYIKTLLRRLSGYLRI